MKHGSLIRDCWLAIVLTCSSCDLVLAQEAISPPIETPFDDGVYWVLQRPLQYRILDTDISIVVPRGFVTDYASVPSIFWSLLSPYGRYGSPAIVHDFLYWDQRCTRKEADDLFELAMQEQEVPAPTRAVIYSSVRAGGDNAWRLNAEQKKQGLSKIIPHNYLDNIPPKTPWEDLRLILYNAGLRPVSDDHLLSKPGYCEAARLKPQVPTKSASHLTRVDPRDLTQLSAKPSKGTTHSPAVSDKEEPSTGVR